MNYQHILYEVSDKIATITLNRPDRMNAWTAIMERNVRHAMETAAADDNVRVKYAVIDDKRSETGMISTSKNDAKSYKISLRNLHERQVAFVVLDQIPVSLNQDIKVEATGKTAPSRRDIDDKRGVIAFDGTLAPDEERTLEFGYKVTWPSPKAVTYGN